MPSPAAGQVRVKVAATSVNLSDWEGLRGSPAYARLGGLRSPAAGRSDRTSPAWSMKSVRGDQVPTRRRGVRRQPGADGGFAEYALAPESGLAHKPAELTFAQASTIPQAGAIALQGTERVRSGSRVLINGAGGGSGSFAIQLAKRLGAHVTGVDNAAKQEFMRSVGADEVIDYRHTDFTRTTEPFDLILDLVAHRSVFAYRRALAPGGRYRCVGGSVRSLLRVLPVGSMIGRATGRSIGVLVVREGPTTSRLSPTCAWLAMSRSTSTARSRSTRSQPRWLMSVRDARWARSSSLPPRTGNASRRWERQTRPGHSWGTAERRRIGRGVVLQPVVGVFLVRHVRHALGRVIRRRHPTYDAPTMTACIGSGRCMTACGLDSTVRM